MTTPDLKGLRVGWIGTGVMGASMAGHLIEAGCALRVYNRSPEKMQSLVDAGAEACTTPADAARGVEVLCSIVGYPRDVEAVLLGPDGALAAADPGTLLIDFTTSSPELARKIAAAAEARDCEALDAPVSGGDIGARSAALSIMVGGSQTAFDRARPLLDCLGKSVVLQGKSGLGQHCKMVNQIIIASSMVGLCEGLLYAYRTGLNPETVLENIGSGAAASWGLTNLWPRMIQQDFEPGFFVEHLVKDLGIALEESRRMEIDLPGLKLASELYQRLVEIGHGRKGTQALLLALEAMNAD